MSALDDGAAFMRFMGGFAQDGSPAELGLAGGQRRSEEARGGQRSGQTEEGEAAAAEVGGDVCADMTLTGHQM